MEDLECRHNVTGLILLYSQAILWCVAAVLSVQIDSQAGPFPTKKMRQLAALPVSYEQPGFLMDILCKDMGEELRNALEGGG